MANPKINIAIDGFSSCGKGTLAKYLAHTLGYKFIDSGAMYRALTLYALRNSVDVNDEEAIGRMLSHISVDFEVNTESKRSDVVLNGRNVEAEIRTMEVASSVSQVARIPSVRKFFVALQQEMGKHKGVVMDGRDIGTVVFPHAELKIFMTANPEVRAMRRFQELQEQGTLTTYEAVLQNLKSRDLTDSTRADSPLTLTNDYKVLDNSILTREQQNALAMSWVKESMPH